MNRTDAADVQSLLHWVAGLAIWQHATDAVDVPDDTELVYTMARLAHTSHSVTGTGLDRDTALVAGARLTITTEPTTGGAA